MHQILSSSLKKTGAIVCRRMAVMQPGEITVCVIPVTPVMSKPHLKDLRCGILAAVCGVRRSRLDWPHATEENHGCLHSPKSVVGFENVTVVADN